MALAHLWGSTPHVSPLLRKARHLGYPTADDLLGLAVARGCRHYGPADDRYEELKECGKERFSNTELSVALLSGSLAGDAHHIRVAAQLLGAPDIDLKQLSRLAQMERCVPILRHIAEAGFRADHERQSFWKELLESLPRSAPVPEGRLPHPSRFMSQPGWTPPSRPRRQATWLRAHG